MQLEETLPLLEKPIGVFALEEFVDDSRRLVVGLKQQQDTGDP
jgi:hypothetical protein